MLRAFIGRGLTFFSGIVGLLVIFSRVLAPSFDGATHASWVVDLVAFWVRTLEPTLGLAVLLVGLLLFAFRFRIPGSGAVALGAMLMISEGITWGKATSPGLQKDRLTVQVANLRWANEQTAPMLSVLADVDADLIILPEWTPLWEEALTAPFHRRGLVGSGRPLAGEANGIAMFARAGRTLSSTRALVLDFESSGKAYPQARMVVAVEGRPVVVYGLHLLGAHYLEGMPLRRPQFQELIRRAQAEKHPVILAGDFNFTNRAPQAATLRRLGYREVAEVCGQLPAPTWPNRGRGGPLDERPWLIRQLPLVLRIDHIYLPPELGCTRTEERAVHGSDHLSVVAEIGFAGDQEL